MNNPTFTVSCFKTKEEILAERLEALLLRVEELEKKFKKTCAEMDDYLKKSRVKKNRHPTSDDIIHHYEMHSNPTGA